MIELALRGLVALTFLVAATLLPLMVGLTGDPELAAAITAVGVPIAALLLAGTMTHYGRWHTYRAELRRWSRLEHPANAPARTAQVGKLTAGTLAAELVVNPLVDPVDVHADQAAEVLYLGRHAVDTPTTVSAAVA